MPPGRIISPFFFLVRVRGGPLTFPNSGKVDRKSRKDFDLPFGMTVELHFRNDKKTDKMGHVFLLPFQPVNQRNGQGTCLKWAAFLCFPGPFDWVFFYIHVFPFSFSSLLCAEFSCTFKGNGLSFASVLLLLLWLPTGTRMAFSRPHFFFFFLLPQFGSPVLPLRRVSLKTPPERASSFPFFSSTPHSMSVVSLL